MTLLFGMTELVAHRPKPAPDAPEVSAARLERDVAHWVAHGFGRWAIEQDSELIGFGGFTLRPDVDGLNLSYHLHPNSWGFGLASEFVADAVIVGFEMLHARRIVGLVRPSNPRSERVLLRAGFAYVRDVQLDGAATRILALSGEGCARDIHDRNWH